jgi:hypothetical protein
MARPLRRGGLRDGELNEHPLLMPLVNVSDDGGTALVRVVDLGMTGQHGGQGSGRRRSTRSS